MKRKIWEIKQKGEQREDIVRDVARNIHEVPQQGIFQLILRRKPANSNINNVRQVEFGYCKKVADYANSKGSKVDYKKIHEFNKKFLCEILSKSDPIFRNALRDAEAEAMNSKIGRKVYMSAWRDLFCRLDLAPDNDALDLFLATVRRFYKNKYNLDLGE